MTDAEMNPERYSDENVENAFRALASHQDFDLVRHALLLRYAEITKFLLPVTDGCALNRAVGKLQEIEWVLGRFGERPYGGLPLAGGISGEGGGFDEGPGAEIGGGYPGGSGSRPPL